jgi:hypothetical protein
MNQHQPPTNATCNAANYSDVEMAMLLPLQTYQEQNQTTQIRMHGHAIRMPLMPPLSLSLSVLADGRLSVAARSQ